MCFSLPQLWDKHRDTSRLCFLLQFILVQHQRGQQRESQLLGAGHGDLGQLRLYQGWTVMGQEKELDGLKNLLRLLH